MSPRLRVGITRVLLVFLLTDFLGFGLLSAYGAMDDPHVGVAEFGRGAEGHGSAPSGCDHACHFAQHMIAAVSERLSAPLCFSSYIAPVLPVVSPTTFCQKTPFHPPRALV